MNAIAALITARAGSKSVPRKNIRPLAGKPLLAYTFEAAKKSRAIQRIVLSTDDPEMADLGRAYGVEVPFLRPPELAGDTTPMIDVALHALAWLAEREAYRPDYLLLLQPTSPFRTAEDIDAAAELARRTSADAVVGVGAMPKHPCHAKTIDAEGRLVPWLGGPDTESRRQDLPALYVPNGAIYLVKRTVLERSRSWCPPGTLAFVMPEERSLDIDTPWDWRVAEAVLRHHE